MGYIISIWQFFQNNILDSAPFLVGLIVLIGYLILRKPIHDTISGLIKAIVGYLIFSVAVNGFFNNFSPILLGLKDTFHLQMAVMDPYFGQIAAQEAITKAGKSFSMMIIVLVIGFAFNLLLVLFKKYTKVRTVFITGQVMVQQSSIALWLVFFCFPSLNNIVVALILGLLLGTYWAVFANLTVEPCQELTEGGGFAFGHQQMLGVWITDKISGLFGNPEKDKKDIGDIKFPKFLSMFNDNVVATSIIVTIFFGIIMLLIGPNMTHKLDPTFGGNTNFIFYIIRKSLTFTVYLSILQLGLRMFISEFVEIFQAISDKLFSGSAVTAVDCATIFGFGHPNILTIGFLFGVIGQVIAIVGLIVFRSPVIAISGFIPLFFDNATFAVFAYKKGGLKASMIIPLLSGVIQVGCGAFAAYYFGLSHFGGYSGNFDWVTLWPVIGFLMNKLEYVGVAIVLIGMLLIPQIQYFKNKKGYFKIVEDYEGYLEDKENNKSNSI